MEKEYVIGDDTNDLKLTINVGTPGIANTVVFQFPDGAPKKKIAESNVDSGNVAERNIGKGADFKNSRLKIRTIVDFGSINPSQWEQLAENIVSKVKIAGGFSGTETYSTDDDDKTISSSGRVVVLDIEVKMI